MALPPIRTKVDVDASGFVGGMNRAIGALGGFRGALALGGAALVGFAGARGLQATTQEAIKFETQVAELAKLVGQKQAEPLSESISDLANVLPVARDELFGAAEGAARLGIRGVGNIRRFTRVTGTIGLVTDVAAEEAATSMARIAKVTETPIEEIENLGSAINEASNTMAVSFSEVLSAAQRAAPGLAQLGASASDVVTLSAAMGELSANASRAGTRLNRLGSTLLKPDAIDVYAAALGVTVEEFERMRDEDPAGVIVDLAQVMRDGGEAADLMNQELDETSLRVLRTLARNVDQTRRRLDSLNDAFEEGTSLQDEFANFAGTAAARTQLVENRIDDLQRKIGAEFLPRWKELLEVTLDILDAFNRFVDTPFDRILPTAAAEELNDLFREVGREANQMESALLRGLKNTNAIVPGLGDALVKVAEATELTDTEMQGLQRTVGAFLAEIDPALADDFVASIRNLGAAFRRGDIDADEFSARVLNLGSRFVQASTGADDFERSMQRLDEAVAVFGEKAGTTAAETQRVGDRFRELARFVPTSKLQQFIETGAGVVRSFNPATQSLDETVGALENLAVNAGAAETSVRGLADAGEELSEEEEERQQKIADLVESLERERDELSLTDQELVRKRLSTLGASAATIEYALSLQSEVSTLEDEAEAEKEARREKERRIEATKRAMEATREENERIGERADQRVESLVSDVRLAKIQEDMRLLNDAADRMAEGFVDAFGKAGRGTESFADAFGQMVTDIIAEMFRLQAQKMFAQFFSGLLGSGIPSAPGPITGVDAPDIAPIDVSEGFGFRRGGLARVAGTGGTDSQLVQFRATPGELVAVAPPERGSVGDRGGGRPSVTVRNEINLHAIDDASVRDRVIRTGLIQEAVRTSVEQAIRAPTKSDAVRSTMLSGQR